MRKDPMAKNHAIDTLLRWWRGEWVAVKVVVDTIIWSLSPGRNFQAKDVCARFAGFIEGQRVVLLGPILALYEVKT